MSKSHTACCLIAACAASMSANAEQVLKEGKFTCRDSANGTIALQIAQLPSGPDKIAVGWQGIKQILQTEPTTTGALRYQGADSKLVYIQVLDHSLLLNEKTMRPILTDCTQVSQG